MRTHKAIIRNSAIGFTLIELLVVLAIIAILLSIVLSMAAGTKTKAKRMQAAAEVRGLVTAIRAYHVEYDRWPSNTIKGGWAWGIDSNNVDLLSWLTASDKDKNPHEINFIEVPRLDASYGDPWGKGKTGVPYRVSIDVYNNSVKAWSCGPNGKDEGGDGDDISWKESVDDGQN